MTPELKKTALEILSAHRVLTIATLRPDGWPQATTVCFANNGIRIYIVVPRNSQKFANVSHDSRVSIAVCGDVHDPMTSTALSMAARTAEVTGSEESAQVLAVMRGRYPEYAAFPDPDPDMTAILRVTPEILSILDYSKGFAHTDLVRVEAKDFQLN
jgi:nitroimidazol reductase NimA-like FMN-containing flavoprotein (pyridoxamine 5'-phosphate oxidase superfamily)